MELDEFHRRVETTYKAGNFELCDELLNACPEPYGECPVCSVIICPHKDPMHFHHDGCPACAEAVEYTQEQVDAMNAAEGRS